ncbi:MAG TPA: hypothetical protein VHB21_09800, partial [Minicystis sp.]|nr:hypothetical protein [Minicystis sp.]
GFNIGDETVHDVMGPSAIGGGVMCVGCHTSTPDGKFVGFTAQGPWGNAVASIEAMSAGHEPPFLGMGAIGALDGLSPLGIQTYSKAHWSNGDHVMLAPYGDSNNAQVQLVWVDLEATTNAQGQSWGVVARNGDGQGVGAPTWSHDGKTIVYVSTNAEFTGRLDNGTADLYAVPYANKQGGAAAPVQGASDPDLEEFYPAFSPDDALLAFNRVPLNTNMYNQPLDELYVVPAKGGSPTRLDANDPPACTAKTSPGVTNAWPKWAPEATKVGSKTYYWLVFSSTRSEAGNPQLYVTGVVDDAGQITSYASLYLWNQPADEDNHTPAWDVFKIPPANPH